MSKKWIVGILVIMMTLSLLPALPSAQAATPDWVLEGQTPGERTSFVSAELPNGTIFIALGYNSTAASHRNDTWLFDHADMSWVQLADSPIGSEGSAGAYADGKIFVFGGLLSTYAYATNVLIYDLETDTWSDGVALPDGGSFMRAIALNETRIIIVGGWNGGSEKCYNYDTTTEIYTETIDMPDGRSAGAMVRVGDDILYFGGWDESSTVRDSVFGYSIFGEYWWWSNAMPEARTSMTGVMGSDGLVYLISGGNSISWYSANVVSVWAYNLNDGDYMELPDVSSAFRYGAAFETDDGSIFYFGGHNDSTATTDIYSLKIWDLEASLSSDSVSQGGGVWLSVSVTTYFATMNGWYGTAYLTSDDVTYAVYDISTLGAAAYLEVAISEGMPAQDYLLELTDLGVNWGQEFHVGPLPLTVVDAPSLEDQIQELSDQNQNLSDQNDILKDKLDALELENNDMAEDLVELKDATDSKLDATIGYLILILVLVTLIVAIVLMVRKK